MYKEDGWFNIIRVDLWSMGDENELVGRLPLVTGGNQSRSSQVEVASALTSWFSASYELKAFANKMESRVYLALDLPQPVPPPNTLTPAVS